MSNRNQIIAGGAALLVALNSFSFFAFPMPRIGQLAATIAAEHEAKTQSQLNTQLHTDSASEPSSARMSPQDRETLILNAFNEARGEGINGIKAVLGVTMARVDSICYPDSVTDVVYQRHQFSWTHQRGSARTLASAARIDAQALQQIKTIVDEYIAEGAKPSTALLYHANYVRPKWTRSPDVKRVKRIGSHLFYDLKDC
ncbi:cell wall hydrolase [Chitinibacter fontanus]|uniref:Cell wall hydrolase n=1 Tax=Chitinibacter fontanus TaxID=1737446 RepID=A0A7D5ZEP0_9NEIS|nr:cell wall hydrolase [Chitinibacter fontanus]QLI81704.1 cell wall hydrolase [Chitinibacter fontanus]